MTVRVIVLTALLAGSAAAQNLEQPELDHGPSNVAAVLGHGGLTAGVSREGELTLLRWPSPGYLDQLEYETSHAADARKLPRFGARDNAGAFVGLYTEPGGLTWLRDGAWTRSQTYRGDESLVLRTEYRHNGLGITVTGTDAVAPPGGAGAHDVLARRYEVEVDQGRSYAVLRLVAFANFAPAVAIEPGKPEAEVTGDAERDLACLYSESARGLVSLLPRDQAALSLATLGNAPSPATVDAFLTGLGANPNAGGVYVVMAGDRTPLGFHCGYDKNFAPIAGLPAPIDASLDAVDGALTGAALAREHANGALAWDVDLAGDGQITLYFAVGATYAEASALLGPARSAGVVTPMTGIADLSDARTGPFLQRALLPVETLVPVASRALLTIYVARDARSGAIASSLAAQPARAVDRPALGAYINLALDLAGQHDLVEAHNLFYTRSQRQGQNGSADPKQGKHEGSWASASFLDSPPGAPGAPAVAPALVAPDSDFAIDATGLALWTLGEHAKWIGDNEQNILNAKQRAYLESVFPAIERAANLLTNCVDAKTALPCPALEADGTAKQPPSLRGAAAAVLGLYSATQSAAVIGKTGDARRWQSRMFALKAQIDKLPPNGFLTADRGYQGDFTARALAIWPAQLHGINDTRTASTALALRTDVTPLFDAHMTGENPARVLLALGIHEFGSARPDAAVKMQLLRWLTAQTTEMRTPVFGFGEVVAAVDPTGYDARVGVPSASEAALVYLATMAVRERPRGETSPLVRLDVRLSANVEGGFQCQFRIAPPGGGAAAALALLLLLAVLVRRRKR